MTNTYEVEVTDLDEPMDMPSVFRVKAKTSRTARSLARKVMRKNFPNTKEKKDWVISRVVKVREHVGSKNG